MSSHRSKRGKAEDYMDSAERRSKRRRLSSSDDEGAGSPSSSSMTPGVVSKLGGDPAGLNGFKTPGLSSDKHKPAELFRKDLISAMKLADSEPLQQEEYFLISDTWRQEWERGVQVPVNPSVIPEIKVSQIPENVNLQGDLYVFKMPRKLLHATKDETFVSSQHDLHETQQLADTVCRYDLDDSDVKWLQMVNAEREEMGLFAVTEYTMEKVMEELENRCHENMKQMIKTVEGLGIEYDEDVICDVCRSPDSEDNNEMVFCDNCDICVHQACYGIQKIPDGSWLCRVCAVSLKPQCILCPNSGGAMKSTRSGTKWAHVSCALWIPEVSIGCADKMEPVTKISQIPSSRWALVCNICREKIGACIQCSVKTCKTAFHVTCAFRNGLEMRTILNDDNEEDDVKLQGYCAKHTKKRRDGDITPRKGDVAGSPFSPKKELTEEEKTELRSHRLHKLAEEFYTCVKVSEVAQALQLDEELVDFVFSYWSLKRKSNFNRPLLTPRVEEEDLLLKQQEDSLVARMKMFVHLRQDLERVRNLCYMVSRREKIRRQLYRLKEEIFLKQVTLVDSSRISSRELPSILRAHKMTDSIYDKPDLHLNQKLLDDAATTSDSESTSNEAVPDNSDTGKPKKPASSKQDVKRKIMFDRKGKGKSQGQGKRKSPEKHEQSDNNNKESEPEAQKMNAEEAPAQVKSKASESTRPRGKENLDHTRADINDSTNSVEPRKSSDRTSPNKKLELNGLVRKNKFVVGESIRDKVHSRLHRANSIKREGPNGILDKSQKSLESFFAVERRAGLGDRSKDGRDQADDSAIPAVAAVTVPSHKVHSNTNSPGRHEGLRSRPACATAATTPDKVNIKLECDTTPMGSKATGTVSSPRNCVSGYRIPRQNNRKSLPATYNSPQKTSVVDSFSESASSYHSPETRSTRRKLESDLESISSDKQYETVEGEISIRSSRDTSPECEVRTSSRRKKGLGISRIAALNELRKKRLRRESGRDVSDSEASDGHASESEAPLSDVDSDTSSFSGRITRSKAIENAEVSSVESGASGGRYTRRSRLSEKWSAALNSLST